MLARPTLVLVLQIVALVALGASHLGLWYQRDHMQDQVTRTLALAETIATQRDEALALVDVWRTLAVKAQQRCGTWEQPL